MPDSSPHSGFRKGDRVVEVLRGAGFEEREPGMILSVEGGIAYFDNGPGNDPTAYDAATGKYAGDGLPGFTRWIEAEPKERDA